MPRKSNRLKSPNWQFPQLALPRTGTPPTGRRQRLKSANCRYKIKFRERHLYEQSSTRFLCRLNNCDFLYPELCGRYKFVLFLTLFQIYMLFVNPVFSRKNYLKMPLRRNVVIKTKSIILTICNNM